MYSSKPAVVPFNAGGVYAGTSSGNMYKVSLPNTGLPLMATGIVSILTGIINVSFVAQFFIGTVSGKDQYMYIAFCLCIHSRYSNAITLSPANSISLPLKYTLFPCTELPEPEKDISVQKSTRTNESGMIARYFNTLVRLLFA